MLQLCINGVLSVSSTLGFGEKIVFSALFLCSDYGMSMAERALRICSCRPSGMRGTKTTHRWISVLTLSSIFSLSPKFSISLSAGYQIYCPAGMPRVQQSSVTTWLNPHNLLHHRTAKIFFWRYRPTKKLTQYFKSKWNIIK